MRQLIPSCIALGYAEGYHHSHGYHAASGFHAHPYPGPHPYSVASHPQPVEPLQPTAPVVPEPAPEVHPPLPPQPHHYHGYVPHPLDHVQGQAYGHDLVGPFYHHAGPFGPFGFYANFFHEK